ncbi:unnamed protein product [Effrenium voratum]|nr:unnamed protein product [Effrenium voratum]
MPHDYRPWTGHSSFRARGLKRTPRVLSIIDALAIQRMKGARVSRKVLKNHLKGQLVDVSQSLGRLACTDEQGICRTQTTATTLYDFEHDRLITGREMLNLQGHGELATPVGMKDSVLADLAGEGMALPCLATILWGLFFARQFPAT